MCRSPDYSPEFSFAQFDDESNSGYTNNVQVVINKKPVGTETRKAKRPYWRIGVKDANGREEVFIVWKEDWARFQEDFEYWDEHEERGKLMTIKLAPWFGNMYQIWSPNKNQREHYIGETKEDDPRIRFLREPEKTQSIIDPTEALDRLGEEAA